jgi:hypothetical protein
MNARLQRLYDENRRRRGEMIRDLRRRNEQRRAELVRELEQRRRQNEVLRRLGLLK